MRITEEFSTKYVQPIEDEFANFDFYQPQTTPSYDQAYQKAQTYQQPVAPAYSGKPAGALSDGLGHWWDEATQSWQNDSGGAYQAPASEPLANSYAGAQDWDIPAGVGLPPQQKLSLGDWQSTVEQPNEGVPFSAAGYESPNNPSWMKLNINDYIPQEDTPWWLNQNPEQPRAASDIRNPDPYATGYKADPRFPEGNMMGDPLDYLLNTFGRPAAETAFQATSPWVAGAKALPGMGGDTGDIFSGWQDLGNTAKQSGFNPNEFMDIQREKYAERPWYQQLAGDAIFDPLNLAGVGAAKKLGLIDDVGDAFRGVDKGIDLAELATGTKKGSQVIPGALGGMPQFAPDLERGLADDFSMGISGGKAYPQLQGAQAFAKGAIPGGAERRVIPDTGDAARIRELERQMPIVVGRQPNASELAKVDEIQKQIDQLATIPQPLANERLWFHSTRDMAYDLPDPDLAVGTQTGITQGPGIYMAADPAKSAGNYGPRTFVAEFDGKTLDLTAKADPAQWSAIRQTIDDRLMRIYDNSTLTDKSVFSPRALAKPGRSELKTAENGYAYRDALVDAVDYQLGDDWNDLDWRQQNALLGRFHAAAEMEDSRIAAQAIVQDAIAENGVDALFHHSPRADGDVLIVLNGDAARTVADVKNAPDAVKGGTTLKDIKRGAVTQIVNRTGEGAQVRAAWTFADDPGGKAVIATHKNGGRYVIIPWDDGKFHIHYGGNDPSMSFKPVIADTLEDAKRKIFARATGDRDATTGIRSFGRGGESGLAGAEFAARLAAQTGLGAGVGAAYGEASGGDWKTGAIVGAGIGAGTAVGFKAADRVASKGVAPKLQINKYPPPPASQKLIDLLKEAKPIRGAQEELYSAERSRRAGIGLNVLKSGGDPNVAFQNARGVMAGKLPTKPDFAEVGHELTPDDLASLLNHIRETPLRGVKSNDFYTKINAETALVKALTGQLPTRSEITLLGKVFGEDLSKALLGKRSAGTKAWENFVDTINLPRTLMTAFDASAPLRQGAILFAGHPIKGLESTGAMIRAMASPEYAKLLDEAIQASPNADIYEKMRLFFADVSSTGELTGREENMMSKLAQNIPLVGGSQRGYNTFLNSMRQKVADGFIAGHPDLSDKEWRDFGHFINVATGRGSLPPKIADQAALMNAFFAPRYAISRFQLPVEMVKALKAGIPGASDAASREAARSLGAFVAAGTTLLTAGKMSGLWDVELDPRSTDFGKGKIGNQRFDFWAGEQQIARLATQMATGQRKTSTGDVIDASRNGIAERWLRTKVSPPVGIAWDAKTGKDAVGNPVDFKSKEGLATQAWNRLTPLFLQDMADAAKISGDPWRALSALPAGAGAGVQTYEDSDTKKRQDWIRENADLLDDPRYVQRGKEPDSYSNLSPKGKELVDKQHGKLEPFGEEAVKAQRELDIKIAQQRDDDAKIGKGMTPEQWWNNYTDRKHDLFVAKDTIYRDLQESGKLESKNPDPILDPYYKAIDAAEGKNGKVDWDKVDKYVKRQSAAEQKYIEEQTGLVKIDTPQVQAMEQIHREIEKSGFFERTDDNWAEVSKYYDIKADSYYEWRSEQRNSLLKSQGYDLSDVNAVAQVESFLDKQAPEKAMDTLRKQWNTEWVTKNPEAAYHAWQLGFYEPIADIKKYLAAQFEKPND